jgi:hypothetical protein
MAIFRLYSEILKYLNTNPQLLHTEKLEVIAVSYGDYAYYGARKTLQSHVSARAKALHHLIHKNENQTLQEWYGKDWAKDSGSFPDFVLEYQDLYLLGDGALIELKDSESEAIASFNSTLPEKYKELSGLPQHVQSSVRWYQQQINKPCPDKRDCFYIIRTKRREPHSVRLSIVEGSFFCTITNQQLLRELWKQVMQEAGLSTDSDSARQILDKLSTLSRDQIAKVRRIEGASIKPRLRVMAEVEADGNPHKYDVITGRTINLIFQHNDTQSKREAEIVAQMFQKDGLTAEVHPENQIRIDGTTVTLCLLQHKRNGVYTVVQAHLPHQ